MIKLLPAGKGVLAAALMLTACTGSAHHAGRLSAAQCTRADATVRSNALLVAPLSGVTTSRELAAAATKMGGWDGRMIRLITKARSKGGTATSSSIGLSFASNSPALRPPLSGAVRRVNADTSALVDALTAYSNDQARPQAVGDAARKAMREIETIRATCSRVRRSAEGTRGV